MKRILYFGYFIMNTDYSELKRNFIETNKKEGLSCFKIFMDMILSSFRYKSSFHDYFMFEFYKKSHEQRNSYLTSGGSYEFYTKLNDKNMIGIFRNKARFNEVFKGFVNRDFIFIGNSTLNDFIKWIDGKDCIIAKPNEGTEGRGIEKIYVSDYSSLNDLYNYLKKRKVKLVEEFIKQHKDMDKINSSSVNTIRVITVRWQEHTDIIAAILRVGMGKHVDNFSAGGIAAPIDITTGRVYKSAISKGNLEKYEYHPITKCRINGFIVPYWNEVVNMVENASKVVPEVKTVGWDIAITTDGPMLIEGNHNWDRAVFQLPYGEGRKYLLNKYIEVGI